MCQEQAENLDNLATVMTLYSRGTFAKDSLQWTKCVVKYLYDVYSDISDLMVNFMVEVRQGGNWTLVLCWTHRARGGVTDCMGSLTIYGITDLMGSLTAWGH